MWPIPKGRAIRSKSNISNSARTGSQSPSALTLAPNQGPGPLPAGPLNTFSPRAAPVSLPLVDYREDPHGSSCNLLSSHFRWSGTRPGRLSPESQRTQDLDVE